MTKKPKVTLVTSANMPELFTDESGLPDALAERGMDPQIAVWNDPTVDWDAAGVCVIRSVSDYATQRQDFINWANSVPRLLNHADVMEWNTDKHYMKDLEALGLPVIPTTWLEPSHGSSGVRDIGRYTAIDTSQRQAALAQTMELLDEGRSVMLQRYLEDIDVHGEVSLVFFNGLLSHAVEKRAVLHPSSVTDPSMHEAVVTARPADTATWQWGEQIRQVLHEYMRSRLGRDELLLYNRVDLVPDGEGSFRVMEVSLVDADLYLEATPDALGNFADAISTRAFW